MGAWGGVSWISMPASPWLQEKGLEPGDAGQQGGLERGPCSVGARAWVQTGVTGRKETWTSQETKGVKLKGLSHGLGLANAREGSALVTSCY